MARVKLNLRGLAIPEKIDLGQQIINALSDTATFPSVQPPVSEGITAMNNLQAGHTDVQTTRQQLKAKLITQNEQEAALDHVLSQWATYVDTLSNGNEKIIHLAGMGVRAVASSSGDLSAPTGLNATEGDRHGEIDLSWDKVNNARSYSIQLNNDPSNEDSWSHVSVSTKSKATVEDLKSGAKYWFRVAAIGSNGQSEWSNPVPKIAP